jgi:hypothetical protein
MPTMGAKTPQKYPDDTAHGHRRLPVALGPIFYRDVRTEPHACHDRPDPAQTMVTRRPCPPAYAACRASSRSWVSKSYLMINAFVYGIYNQDMALPH